jgi:hypothetical protein
MMALPVTPVRRRKHHELAERMLVRPRNKKGKRMDASRWIVQQVCGAFTRARHGGVSQFWATDSLIPVVRKGSGRPMFARQP